MRGPRSTDLDRVPVTAHHLPMIPLETDATETAAEDMLLDHAPYAPFLDSRTARPPGLMPLSGAPTIVVLPDYAAQMARRADLLARKREVVHSLPAEAMPAARELFAMVTAEAAASPGFARDGDRWRRPDGVSLTLDPEDPLASLGLLGAEDWCLLSPDPASGEYRLAAAVLCFPSRWSLAEKLGRPLTAIHAPVPDYDATLARRVNRVFEALRPGRGLWRVNWLVHPSAEPHLPGKDAQAPDDKGLFLRTERQTLIRLPQTGAVAFGIKTSICPLAALTRAETRALAGALGDLDPSVIAYRSGGDVHARALAALAG